MELIKYKVCPSCGEHNKPTYLECRSCGMDLTGIRVVDSEIEQRELLKEQAEADNSSPEEIPTVRLVRVCEECGTENAPQARKCEQCGEEISDILPVPSSKPTEKAFSYCLNSADGLFNTTIDKPLFIVGREAGLNEYLGCKAYVSRHHAELTVVAGKVFIKNLSGTNKTFVNNEEITNDEPYALTYGDEIGLGGKVISGERQDNAAYFIFKG